MLERLESPCSDSLGGGGSSVARLDCSRSRVYLLDDALGRLAERVVGPMVVDVNVEGKRKISVYCLVSRAGVEPASSQYCVPTM